MRITIFDYGAGNLHSLAKAIAAVAGEPVVETDPVRAVETDVLVLPGVGAFTPAAERIAPGREAMRSAILGGLRCLGICLGMQLLLDRSEEGPGLGLGVVAGEVTTLRASRRPQIGWNEVSAGDPLVARAGLRYGYYANGFACRPADPSSVVAWSEYEGDRFPAALRSGGALGVQFHPEKSSGAGLALLDGFFREVAG
ncbi:MAG: imidazole glycerol phosphate synthase subunit HisH [Gemmatimonadales bacterium]